MVKGDVGDEGCQRAIEKGRKINSDGQSRAPGDPWETRSPAASLGLTDEMKGDQGCPGYLPSQLQGPSCGRGIEDQAQLPR